MSEVEDAVVSCGEYGWRTDEAHADNIETMDEFLEEHLPESAGVVMTDGTYAEIVYDGSTYAVHASGDGDFFNHKVEFVLI